MPELTEKRKRRLNTLPLATAVIALLRVSACSSKFLTTAPDNAASTLATATHTPKLPLKATSNISTSLSDIGKYSKAIYDTAKVHDWTTAAVQLASLQNATELLHPGFNTSKDVVQFHASMAALDIAVATQERPEAMHRANQLMLITANMTTQFQPLLPVEVKLLEYYGRELEVWALAKNVAKLKTTSNNIHQTWDTLRPLVNSQGAKVLSQKFSNLVLCVDAAKSANDYSHLTNSFLESVENLEKIFKK